ncbi:hypothetical protein HY639_01120 [Candidatus Woesearchaeota archaeon]|nr:hypothetical protein [Candidatus Woesearchaeota archaeon]
MSDDDLRREQLVTFLRTHKKIITWLLLAFIIYTATSVRFSNLGYLKDVTSGNYVAADLDAFLFYRYAEYILEHGTAMEHDSMRYYPYGEPWDLLHGHQGFPHFLVMWYKFLHFFNGAVTFDYAYIIYPTAILALTLLVFFLLVQTVFGSFAGLLATAALGYSPAYLFRTMTGVADHDAVGMLMLTLSLFLYMKALQQETVKMSVFYGFLTGLSTITMVFVWLGAGNFLYLILGGTTLVQIFLNLFHEKDYFAYLTWFITFLSGLEYLELLSIGDLLGSTTTEMVVLALGTGTIYYLLFEKDIFGAAPRLKKLLPSGITCVLCTVFIGLLLISAVHGPTFLFQKAGKLYGDMVAPWAKDRWQLTVAEQHQPYLVDWYGQMGKYYVLFFLLGSVYLFYELMKPLGHHLKKVNIPYISMTSLVLFYAAFIFSFTFSRYSQDSTLNGTNSLSIWLYLGSLVVFIVGFFILYTYLFYQNRDDFYNAVSQLNKTYILIFVWFFFMTVGARGAIRLVFTYTPVTTLLFGYFVMRLFELANGLQDKLYRVPALLLLGLLVLSPISLGSTLGKGILPQYYDGIKAQAQYTGTPYNQQWQLGMDWVRRNTPQDAVFAHWWDYGYWVQTGGQRATVTDGGNEHANWNYQIGRHVLTGQNQTEALEVLAAHNATHLLIIADEIGKYTAFSSIGSDANYDRYSWVNVFTQNLQLSQQTRNGTTFLYQGQYPLDDDFMYKGEFFPKMASGIGGFLVPFNEVTVQEGNTTAKRTVVSQPKAALFSSNGQRTDVPLECLYIDGQFITFPEPGLKGCLKIIPTINGDKQNIIGAGLYVSEEGVKAMWTNLYLFDGKNPRFPVPAFELAYDDSDKMPFLVYNGRLIGPLRIWKVNYPKEFSLSEEKENLYLGFAHENPEATKI